MRPSRIAVASWFVFAISGCGTIHNLNDRPQGPMFMTTGACYPFGGVTRSVALAAFGPPCGTASMIGGAADVSRGKFADGFPQVGSGACLTAAGLVALVDTPLSLCGDVVTYPLAYARSKEYPWATWWGAPSVHGPWCDPPTRIHGGITPAESPSSDDEFVPCG